jgi:hypothetical protein
VSHTTLLYSLACRPFHGLSSRSPRSASFNCCQLTLFAWSLPLPAAVTQKATRSCPKKPSPTLRAMCGARTMLQRASLQSPVTQPCRCCSAHLSHTEVVGTRELVAKGGTQSPPRRALLTASSNLRRSQHQRMSNSEPVFISPDSSPLDRLASHLNFLNIQGLPPSYLRDRHELGREETSSISFPVGSYPISMSGETRSYSCRRVLFWHRHSG